MRASARLSQLSQLALALLALGVTGCVSSRPPTMAHVHIGHAITGVAITPGQKGYLLEAEERAQGAYELANKASTEGSLAQIKLDVAEVVKATNSEDDFGLKHSLALASNHITFAATSDDASDNVKRSAPVFAHDITRVVERCDEIGLLGKDVQAAGNVQEATLLTVEIRKLAQQNVNGEDAHGTGVLGATPEEYGMKQLRKELQDMIARENPPYTTVDQYYLFNLVRLPNGKWVYDKLARGGNIDSGYK
jgi:hypothetical protein